MLGRFGAAVPADHADDQLRLIRLGLQLALDPPVVVAITPLSAAEPVRALGSGLAGSLHSAGHTTVLVDARVDTDAQPAGRAAADCPTSSRGELPRPAAAAPRRCAGARSGGTAPAAVRDRYSGPPLQAVLERLREAVRVRRRADRVRAMTRSESRWPPPPTPC